MLVLLGAAAAFAALPAARAAADMSAAAKDAARADARGQWHALLHRLAGLMVDERRVGDLLGPVLRYKYELPPAQVQRSLVYVGANERLRRVVHDLMVGGRTVKVGAIGGSITHGAKASVIGETDWFSLVGRYLRGAFPRANVTTRNGALPATPSALMNMCLETYVDDDVDLVFVEYVANDGSNALDTVKPKVYERLVRKLLNKRNRPAVVLVQLMPKGMAFAPGNREKVPFAATLEDVYGAQAQYYDLPWLSFRNAMYHLAEFHR
jgi:lysophospholipase L1-like esterase